MGDKKMSPSAGNSNGTNRGSMGCASTCGRLLLGRSAPWLRGEGQGEDARTGAGAPPKDSDASCSIGNGVLQGVEKEEEASVLHGGDGALVA